jgi:lipopolysaccharide/colanic/teichoic acid biosynthesis glycosyltransferase
MVQFRRSYPAYKDKSKNDRIHRLLNSCDLLVAFAAPFLAVRIRSWFETPTSFSPGSAVYVISCAVATIFFLWSFGAGRAVWRFFTFPDAVNALKAISLGVAIGAAIGFFHDHLYSVARSVPFIQVFIQMSSYVGLRFVMRKYGVSAATPQIAQIGVLLVGCNATAEIYVRAVEALSRGTLRIVGILSDDPAMIGQTLRGHRIFATISNIEDAFETLKIHGVEVGRVVIAASGAEMPAHIGAMVLRAAERFAVPVVDIHSLFREVARRDDDDVAFELEAVFLSGRYWVIKRIIDFVAALILIVLMAPLLAVAATVVAFDVGHPIIFWQHRRGRHGRPFKVYKFRSMRDPLGPDGFVLTDEERTSEIGHLMRKTRLDELPQLFNILYGDMSFVGPRPLLPVDQPSEIAQRLAVRPGLTGWAQVNGGKLVSPKDKCALDLWHMSHADLWLDLRIVVMTIVTFVRGDVLDAAAIGRATAWLKSSEAADHALCD